MKKTAPTMNPVPEIAIVDANTLTCLGLKSMLEEIIPAAVIRVFSRFGELSDDTPDMYAHYFVSAQVYAEHTSFFLPRRKKTIVLAGSSPQFQLSGVNTLDIYASEKELVKSLLRLHRQGHSGRGTAAESGHAAGFSHELLSPREIEVLVLVVQGCINKEIADRLHISLTTVISHRKNITEKLGIKSVSGLTIYAVMNGYVEIDRI